jgi:hypothetical protein
LPSDIISHIQYFNPEKKSNSCVDKKFYKLTLKATEDNYRNEIKLFISHVIKEVGDTILFPVKEQLQEISKNIKFDLGNFKRIENSFSHYKKEIFDILEKNYKQINKSSLDYWFFDKQFSNLSEDAISFFASIFIENIKKDPNNIKDPKRFFDTLIKEQINNQKAEQLILLARSMDSGSDRNTMIDQLFKKLIQNKIFLQAIDVIKLSPRNESRYFTFIKGLEESEGFDKMLDVVKTIDNNNVDFNVKGMFISVLAKTYLHDNKANKKIIEKLGGEKFQEARQALIEKQDKLDKEQEKFSNMQQSKWDAEMRGTRI